MYIVDKVLMNMASFSNISVFTATFMTKEASVCNMSLTEWHEE